MAKQGRKRRGQPSRILPADEYWKPIVGDFLVTCLWCLVSSVFAEVRRPQPTSHAATLTGTDAACKPEWSLPPQGRQWPLMLFI